MANELLERLNSGRDMANEETFIKEMLGDNLGSFEKAVGAKLEATPIVEEQPKVEEEVAPEVVSEQKEEQPAKEEVVFNNPLLKDLNIKKQVEEVKIEKPEDVFSLLSTEAGNEIKDINSLKEFVSKYKETETKVKEYSELANRAKQYDELMESLPDEVYGLVYKAVKGEDYFAEMKKLVSDTLVPFDHNIPFEKQDKKVLLNYLFPNQFTEDDFEDLDTASMKAVMSIAKEKYEGIQSKLSAPRKTNYREVNQKQLDEYRAKFEESINKSVSKISENSKHFTPQQINSIQADMMKGQEYVLSMYFNEDGTWKENAVENLLFNSYGKQALQSLKEFVSKRSETKVVEEILERKPEKKTIKETPANKMMEIIQNQINSNKNEIKF